MYDKAYFSPEGVEVNRLITLILHGMGTAQELDDYGRDTILPELLKLDAFAKGIDALGPGHPIRDMPIVLSLLHKRRDLDYQIRNIEGFLFVHGQCQYTHMPRYQKIED